MVIKWRKKEKEEEAKERPAIFQADNFFSSKQHSQEERERKGSNSKVERRGVGFLVRFRVREEEKPVSLKCVLVWTTARQRSRKVEKEKEGEGTRASFSRQAWSFDDPMAVEHPKANPDDTHFPNAFPISARWPFVVRIAFLSLVS